MVVTTGMVDTMADGVTMAVTMAVTTDTTGVVKTSKHEPTKMNRIKY
jgi:hypothetical protein